MTRAARSSLRGGNALTPMGETLNTLLFLIFIRFMDVEVWCVSQELQVLHVAREPLGAAMGATDLARERRLRKQLRCLLFARCCCFGRHACRNSKKGVRSLRGRDSRYAVGTCWIDPPYLPTDG